MVDILAFGAHPDDCEFACGGILCKMAAEGKSLVIVDLSIGDKGSNGTEEERRQEGLDAAKLIGAEREYLDFKDCEIIDSYENRLKLVAAIRKYKPKIVLAPLWKGEQNHPDHIACGLMARYACRYARFRNVMPEIPPHKVGTVLHYLFPVHDQPDFLIDVSDHVDTWKQLLQCHKSQMKSNDYIGWNIKAAARFGIMTGTSHAQGLVKGNPLVIDDLMNLSKSSLEI
jgi:N-acetylglucosamine malate deacetylase 1